jgi:hypothetical protein
MDYGYGMNHKNMIHVLMYQYLLYIFGHRDYKKKSIKRMRGLNPLNPHKKKKKKYN